MHKWSNTEPGFSTPILNGYHVKQETVTVKFAQYNDEAQDIHNKSLKMILAYSLRITQRKTRPDERLPLMSGGDISCGQRDAVPTWRDVTHGEN